MRLRGHRCFDHLHRNGRRLHGTHMVLRLADARSSLLKRPLLQAEQRQQASLADCWILLSLKPGAAEAETLLLEECDRLLKDAGLLP